MSIVADLVRLNPDVEEYVWYVVQNGAGARTLEAIDKLPADRGVPKKVVDAIRNRLTRKGDAATKAEPGFWERIDRTTPTQERLLQLQQLFKEGKHDDDDEALPPIAVLVRHDPEFMAKYLKTFAPPNSDDWRAADEAYVTASLFAAYCKADRVKHLKSLLGAKDPWVQVAGAVYLAYEDEKAALPELRERMKLDSLPGAWAAVTLARRGDKAAASRALDVLFKSTEQESRRHSHRFLATELLVLFSNSAQASKVPFRPAETGQISEPPPMTLTGWWQANSARVTLADPWLPILRKQPID